MRGTMLYGPRDVRFEEREDPKIINPTDAIIKISARRNRRRRFDLPPQSGNRGGGKSA